MASKSNKSVPKLFVRVLQAEGVKAADFGGTSDPYCIVSIKSNKSSEHKTQVCKETINPQWNERFIFHPTAEEMETGALLIKMYDDDIGRDDLLGELEIPLANFETKRNGEDAWWDLMERKSGNLKHAKTKDGDDRGGLGKIRLRVTYKVGDNDD